MARKKKTKGNRYKKADAKKGESIKRALVRAGLVLGFVASTALLGFACIFTYDLFTQSPYFNAVEIKVAGCERLTPGEVMEAAGLSVGVNILAVSLNGVNEQLESHPWIVKARVHRVLPRGISIRITERKPVAILNLGQKFLMDDSGEIFKGWEKGDPENLPVVEGLSLVDISLPGEPMQKPFASVVEFLRKRVEHGWSIAASDIEALFVDRDMGLTMVAFDPPIAVRMGFDDYAEKLTRLHQVLFKCTKPRGITAVSIDIQDMDRVVVRPTEKIILKQGSAKEV